MKRAILIRLLSGVLNIVTCLFAVAIVLYLQDWFGKGDVYALVFWTIPLAAGLAAGGDGLVNIIKTPNVLLKILFILLVSGFTAFAWICVVYLILGPWINTFSFPVFPLWIIGNFVQLVHLENFSPKDNRPKLATVLITIPLGLVGSVVLMYVSTSIISYVTRPEPETYLIKENFEGKFRVIYGEKCGVEPKIENGRRILDIPDNGLLVVRSEFKTGIIDFEYYLVDSNGNRTKMNEMVAYDNKNLIIPGVLFSGAGVQAGKMPDGSLSSESPLAIHFTDFLVFNKDTTGFSQRTQFETYQSFDSLFEVVISDCRKKSGM